MSVETWDAFHDSVRQDVERLKDGGFVAVDYRQEVEGTGRRVLLGADRPCG